MTIIHKVIRRQPSTTPNGKSDLVHENPFGLYALIPKLKDDGK